ncbi:response regulator [Candidatus Woesearchaeota archaeon]|nr:response regulator [Candidatus Woesearchaeota archaeon]
MEKAHVFLVVDDEELNRNFLEAAIGSNFPNAIVKKVPSGKDAIPLLESIDFDVVISDYEMPGMNGIELYNKVNEFYKQNNKNIRFILSSAKGDAYSLAREKGIPFMPKPFKIKELFEIMEKAMDS